jgi:hypothetical protein
MCRGRISQTDVVHMAAMVGDAIVVKQLVEACNADLKVGGCLIRFFHDLSFFLFPPDC